MNTINMGVIAKTKQYGTMRAIGMSNQQLIKMIVAEAMTYAVSGIILGCINKLCTGILYDKHGQPHVCIDEYMKRHLEIKLISSIVTKAETG